MMSGISQCTNTEVEWCHPGIFTNPRYLWPSEPGPLSPTSSSRRAFRAAGSPRAKHELEMRRLVQDVSDLADISGQLELVCQP